MVGATQRIHGWMDVDGAGGGGGFQCGTLASLAQIFLGTPSRVGTGALRLLPFGFWTIAYTMGCGGRASLPWCVAALFWTPPPHKCQTPVGATGR